MTARTAASTDRQWASSTIAARNLQDGDWFRLIDEYEALRVEITPTGYVQILARTLVTGRTETLIVHGFYNVAYARRPDSAPTAQSKVGDRVTVPLDGKMVEGTVQERLEVGYGAPVIILSVGVNDRPDGEGSLVTVVLDD